MLTLLLPVVQVANFLKDESSWYSQPDTSLHRETTVKMTDMKMHDIKMIDQVAGMK